MNLNCDIIYDQLAGILNMKKTGVTNKNAHLQRPEHYIEGTAFSSDRLYIVRADMLPAKPVIEANSCIFSIGCPLQIYYTDHASLLVTEDQMELNQVFNLIQAVYNRIDDWDQALQRCVWETESLQAMLDTSRSLFINPISVTDVNFHVLAATTERGFVVMDERGDVPEWAVNEFKLEPSWQKFKESSGLYLYQSDLLEYDVLCCTLKIQGKYAGGITLSELHGTSSPGMWALFQNLAKYVQLSYEQYCVNLDTGIYSFKYFCKQLLDGVQLSRPSIEKALELLSWHAEHNYSVYYIELNKKDHQYNTTNYICRHLEGMFQYAVAFEHNGNVVTVINASLLSSDAPKIYAAFNKYITEAFLKVGISKIFTDIFQFQNYYLQAFAALEMGLRLHPMQWIHHFQDYCLDYMLEHCCSDLTSLSLCPAGLLSLKAYDEAHGTQYLKTLAVYFQNKFNTTHSAQALFIHRSTLLERLERIEKFLKLDLNNPDIQLYLMLCLRLIEKQITSAT